jgi:hypothetical protein
MKKIGFALSLVLASSLALGGCAADSDGDASAEGGDEQDVTAAVKSSRIETYAGVDGQQYFHLVAKNGEVILQSEGYTSLDAAKTGVRSVLENGARSDAFEIREARDGEHYFVLKAGNNEIIGVGETYTSRSNAERGLTTVTTLVRELANKESVPAPAQARFETFTGEDSLTYFSMRAKNGETVLSSQGYQTAQSAKKGVTSVKTNGVDAARYEILEARDGQFYVRLKAANGEVIARSEMYASKSNATRARDTMVSLLTSGEAR